MASMLLDRWGPEFREREARLAELGFQSNASGLGFKDAFLFYAMLRQHKPKRVVEVGAGGSTFVAAAALESNALHDGISCEFTTIDPNPSQAVSRLVERRIGNGVEMRLLASRGQDVDERVYDDLAAGDVLFVDSSHVYRTGSDVEHQFMHIYPNLQSEVFVHVHDIFLPFEYPYEWNARNQWFWNEQYVLEAFLQFNTKYRVLLGAYMLDKNFPDLFARSLPADPEEPKSFWMKTVG